MGILFGLLDVFVWDVSNHFLATLHQNRSAYHVAGKGSGLGYKTTGELGAKAWFFFDFRQERADQALHSWAYWQFKYNHDAWMEAKDD